MAQISKEYAEALFTLACENGKEEVIGYAENYQKREYCQKYQTADLWIDGYDYNERDGNDSRRNSPFLVRRLGGARRIFQRADNILFNFGVCDYLLFGHDFTVLSRIL